jgi:ABC-type branched-subunit amino acid transport system substrate-binding protein
MRNRPISPRLNAEGGINGRKINLISLDDGYMPPKALEQVRRLVERDKVLLVFNSVGTATNIVLREYLNTSSSRAAMLPGVTTSTTPGP